MFCIVYELLYDNYMGITWQLYVKYKVITRMAFSIAKRFLPTAKSFTLGKGKTCFHFALA